MDVPAASQGPPRDIAGELAPAAPEWLLQQLKWWMAEAAAFTEFCRLHRCKIAAKFRNAPTAEDKRDVHAELEVAWRFLRTGVCNVDYEPAGKWQRGSDFLVRTQFGSFCAEVKRIRQTDISFRFYRCLGRIVGELRKLPSSLGFSIDFESIDASATDYVKNFEQVLDSVVAECTGALPIYEKELGLEASAHLQPAEFPGLKVTFTRIDKAQDSPTSFIGASYPLLFTGSEFRAFGDKILDSLRQLRGESANVLFLVTHSDVHGVDDGDLAYAIRSLRDNAERKDELFFNQHKLKGSQDFTGQFNALSAIVVVPGSTRAGQEHDFDHLVWKNESGPALDGHLLDILRTF